MERFEEVYQDIMANINGLKIGIATSRYRKRRLRHLLYNYILLTILTNGCNVMEAIEAVKKFIESGETTVSVKLARKEGERLIILPIKQYIDGELLKLAFKHVILDENILSSLSHYSRRQYGVTTYQLRLLFAEYFAEKFGTTYLVEITKNQGLAKKVSGAGDQAAQYLLASMVKGFTTP